WCEVVGSLPTGGRLVAVAGVDGAGYERVQGCWCACWSRFGSCCWSWLVSMARDICVFEHVRGCGWGCWRSFRSPGCLLVGVFCVFTGVGGVAGRRLGRLGCLLVDDFCGAGVGLLSVRGCGLRWWPLTWSSRVTVRRGLRVGEAAPWWCEAVGEAVGCWCD